MILGLIAFAALIVAVAWWVRRKGRDVEDFYERDYKDPPIHGWFPGGGPGGT